MPSNPGPRSLRSPCPRLPTVALGIIGIASLATWMAELAVLAMSQPTLVGNDAEGIGFAGSKEFGTTDWSRSD